MELERLNEELQLGLSYEKIEKLNKFINIFEDKNRFLNLSSLKNEDEFLKKHILDSLFVNKLVSFRDFKRVVDIGTGGGLPGIPLSIILENIDFTLIDSKQKKIKAVNEFIKDLSLKNAKGISARLEEISHENFFRESFDAIISRALAPLNILIELAIPFIKNNGIFIAMKGPSYKEELNLAKNAIKILSLDLLDIIEYKLLDGEERCIMLFKKNQKTNKIYPRKITNIKKTPL